MGNSAEQIEQQVTLKDGREIYKTHNGFKSFVKNKKGEVTEVTGEYYKEALRLKKK